FAASLDGQPVNITELERSTAGDQPLGIVLLFDISKSMASGNALVSAREAGASFIAKLAPRDQVSVMTFGESISVLSDFSTDRNRAQQILRNLKPTDNRTVLYDALHRAAEQATTALTSRAAVIVLTDGKDVGSRVTLRDAVDRSQAERVAVYTLGFGPKAD